MNILSSIPRADLLLLKNTVLLLLAGFVAAALLAGGGFFFRKAQAQGLQQAAENRDAAVASLNQAEEEAETIRWNVDAYSRYLARGMLAPENRVDLIDSVRQSRERHRLFPVQFEIGEQKIAAINGASGYALRFSPISVSLGLLHEGDLVNLLEDLHDTGEFFVLESCIMERVGNFSPLDPLILLENLRATCRMRLITMRERTDRP